MSKNVGAGIVVFNPDVDRLVQNIENISGQVSKIFLYANSDISNISDKLKKFDLVILGDGTNIGLAKALNEIMECASSDEHLEWVITFDQDSIAPSDIISKMEPYFDQDDVGIICPQVIDKRRPYMKVCKKDNEYVNRCITSASCTRIKAWKNVGRFDDVLFIDLIDNDFCKRLVLTGWKILKLNHIILDQEFGNIKLKSPKIVKFIMGISRKIKNKNLSTNVAKLSYKKVVSPTRVYYTNRNVIYLNKKFKKYDGIGYECYSCNSYFGFWIVFNLASFVRGKQKKKILKAIFTGVRDGKKMQADIFEAK